MVAVARFDNRITRLLGVDVPIANSPMGFVAKANLVAAVSMAGGIGLVPGSMGIAGALDDIKRVRDMTDRPFGVNLPIAYVQDPSIADMLVEERIPYVTTSAGSPMAYTPVLKAAGIKVLHVVTSLDTAKEAIDAGVDGLVVEGIEGAGLKGQHRGGVVGAAAPPRPQARRAPHRRGRHRRRHLDGRRVRPRGRGRADGHADAGLGRVERARRAQAGGARRRPRPTPCSSTARTGKPLRVLRTETTAALEFATEGDPMRELLPNVLTTYTEGIIENSLPSIGQVAGRIDSLLPVAEIMRQTVEEFAETIRTARRAVPGRKSPVRLGEVSGCDSADGGSITGTDIGAGSSRSRRAIRCRQLSGQGQDASRSFAAIVIALAGGTMSAAAAAVDPIGPQPAQASPTWVVTLVGDGTAPNEASHLVGREGGRLLAVYSHVLNGFAFSGSADAAAALRVILGSPTWSSPHAPRSGGRAQRHPPHERLGGARGGIHRRHRRRYAGARGRRRHRDQARPRRSRREHRSRTRRQLHQPGAAGERRPGPRHPRRGNDRGGVQRPGRRRHGDERPTGTGQGAQLDGVRDRRTGDLRARLRRGPRAGAARSVRREHEPRRSQPSGRNDV